MILSKHKKGSDDYLMECTDLCISDLVVEKEHLYKAYNYYSGKRDHYQYEHLEKNDGIGNPTSISFTPLIRKHVDAIVGEFLTTEIRPRISCKDEKTLTNIYRDKLLEIESKKVKWLSKFLSNAVYEAIIGKKQKDQETVDAEVERQLNAIKEAVNLNFISNYEIAGLDIVQYIMQARKMDFKNKLRQLLLDLLIAAESYYKVIPTSKGSNFKIEIEDPLNTFTDKDPKSPYIKDGYRDVVRKWMTKEEIIIKYGDELSTSDIKELSELPFDHVDYNNKNFILVRSLGARCGDFHNPGIWDGVGIHPVNDDLNFRKWDVIPVYEVEWIDWDKEKDGSIIGKRYETVRIGADMYILRGEDKNMVRDMDAPNEARLQLNGMFYTDGHGAPYSLMLATADLQDSYDLLLFYKDNNIALSGAKGAHVDVSMLPEFLGDDLPERIMKYMAYRKSGIALFDSSQEGNLQNTYWNGFNDTVDANSVQAILIAIEMIENTASSITGVFRERLGGIQLRDAVANVEAGMLQSYIITKLYYQVMDTLVSEMLTDALNIARRVYKKGLTGEIILGNRKEIFTLLPEYYSLTDYDVHLADSTEIMKEQEVLKQLAMQLATSNQVDVEILSIIMTSKSLTEMKSALRQSIHDKKLENDQLQQLQQALQEAQSNQEKLQKQLEDTTKKLATLNQDKLNIERADNEMKNQIQWYKVKSDADVKQQQVDLIKQRNEIEKLQIIADDGKQNDEVVDSKY